MKANELMIGDWVCLEDENLPLKERYFNIEYIAISAGVSWVNQGTNAPIGLGDGESLIPVFIDEISPIPLTPEILNKNGFVNSYIDVNLNKDSVYKYNHFYTGNSVIVDMESNKLIVKYENDIWMNLPYSRTIYVHELQHVLKHCDIKKEIII